VRFQQRVENWVEPSIKLVSYKEVSMTIGQVGGFVAIGYIVQHHVSFHLALPYLAKLPHMFGDSGFDRGGYPSANSEV
jgi:hypothetical protein